MDATSNTMAQSTNLLDYEILIRRYDGGANYASYCPQLSYMIKGSAHEEVEEAMKNHILAHIEEIKKLSASE